MTKVGDLVDPATRALMAAAAAGGDDEAEEAEEAARSLLPQRRHDAVGTWPADRLDELAAKRPDLLPEIVRRRGGELTQL